LGKIYSNTYEYVRRKIRCSFWLNAGGRFQDVPKGYVFCSGYQGQMILIIPSLDLVVVRMGLKESEFNFNEIMKGIIASIKHMKCISKGAKSH
jgi:CubicO group peptidase (beta-lactamase class C family)